MKKMIFVMILVLSLTLINFSVLAGEVKVNVNQDSIETDDEFFMGIKDGGIKANGGPQIGVLQLDLSELNEKLEGAGFKALENNMIFFGGGGIGGIKNGSRFGGYGMTGKVMTNNGVKKAILTIY